MADDRSTCGADPAGGDWRHSGRPVTEEVGHERQILVVGDGLAALASAGFLEQAGLDPVLATAAAEAPTPEPAVVTVWRPGLALLARLGLRRPVERLGTPLNRLRRLPAGTLHVADSTERPALVAITPDRLRDLLATRIRSRVRSVEPSVRTLEPTAGGVRATFERGIREPFDAVVTDAESLRSGTATPDAGEPVHSWTFAWPGAVSVPSDPIEAWDDPDAAFLTPVDDSYRVRLVTDGATTAAGAVGVAALQERFGHLFGAVPEPFGALDRSGLAYSRTRAGMSASMHRGPVAFVGPAARGSLPGDRLRSTLGVEDAWVLADALAYGPSAVDEALGTYERRRLARAHALDVYQREGRDRSGGPAEGSPLLRDLYRAGRLAFSHVLEGAVAEPGREIPGRL